MKSDEMMIQSLPNLQGYLVRNTLWVWLPSVHANVGLPFITLHAHLD
jgi:hypothetical protein